MNVNFAVQDDTGSRQECGIVLWHYRDSDHWLLTFERAVIFLHVILVVAVAGAGVCERNLLDWTTVDRGGGGEEEEAWAVPVASNPQPAVRRRIRRVARVVPRIVQRWRQRRLLLLQVHRRRYHA